MQNLRLLQTSYQQFYNSVDYRVLPHRSADEANSALANPPAPLNDHMLHRFPWQLSAIVLLSFVMLTSMFLGPYEFLSTAVERELANAYRLNPSFSTFRKIRTAQSIADLTRSVQLLSVDRYSSASNNGTHVRAGVDADKTVEDVQLPDGCEATVMLLRHCEKANIREHCAYMGYERSVYLASLFGDHDERWPSPNFIFALSPRGRHDKRKMNFREIETVGPLAEKAGVIIDDSYMTSDLHKLTKDILRHLRTGDLCGKLIVISWKHSEIPSLAHHLGCGPLEGCPIDYNGYSFDEVWQIKYTYRTMEHSDQRNLELPDEPEWQVFGNVQSQGFDPLAFSKQFGSYQRDGPPITAALWEKAIVEFPERRRPTDTSVWQTTRVGFEQRKQSPPLYNNHP